MNGIEYTPQKQMPAGAALADRPQGYASRGYFFVARVCIRRQPVSVELRHLRYFVAVAEELSFRNAAKRLHIAQPPLGRQIRDLEEEIGTPLFDRSRNHVRLTGAGQVFLAGARETLEAAAQAIAGARKATRSAVPLPFRIGKFGFFTASFLSQALSMYKDTHSNVSISLFGMDPQAQLDGLLADQLDLAFVPTFDLLLRRRVAKQIEAQPVLRSPLMCCCRQGTRWRRKPAPTGRRRPSRSQNLLAKCFCGFQPIRTPVTPCTWCVSVAGEANFAPAWDRKAATIRTSSTW